MHDNTPVYPIIFCALLTVVDMQFINDPVLLLLSPPPRMPSTRTFIWNTNYEERVVQKKNKLLLWWSFETISRFFYRSIPKKYSSPLPPTAIFCLIFCLRANIRYVLTWIPANPIYSIEHLSRM